MIILIFLYTGLQDNLFGCSSEHSETGFMVVLITTIHTTPLNHPPAPTQNWLQACWNFSLSLLNSCSAQNCHCSRAELPWQLSWPGCRHAALQAQRWGVGRQRRGPAGAGDGCDRAMGKAEGDQVTESCTTPPETNVLNVPSKKSHLLKRRK